MTVPDLPDHPDRGALVEVVAWCMGGDGTEAEQEVVHGFLDRWMPDPRWSEIIYWPDRHPVAIAREATDPTPSEVVEIAFEYRVWSW